jgi:hypothetical protein
VVASFGGVRSAKGFAKRYELHYQPRKIKVKGVKVQGQYGCLNFSHEAWRSVSKVTMAVKNKWSGGWTQAGFTTKFQAV